MSKKDNKEHRLRLLVEDGANVVGGLAIELAEKTTLEEVRAIGQRLARLGETIVDLADDGTGQDENTNSEEIANTQSKG